jgi:RNA polymerase sigma-70 factor (ECF subfamily)
MANDDEDLDVLMTRLAEGDRSVFSAVFARLWPATERFCRSLLRNEADASDAAQEAMQKVLERASDYDPTRPAMPWALAIAAWECRTLRRKRFRRREVLDDLEHDRAGDDEEEALVKHDLAEAALAAMGELSEVDRETLLSTFADEAPSGGGATFRKRRERALGRLRKAFRRLYGIG